MAAEIGVWHNARSPDTGMSVKRGLVVFFSSSTSIFDYIAGSKEKNMGW